MRHSFDKNVAMIVGINAAIIHSNLTYWCEKNKANDHNMREDRYWTFNSVKAWGELFPYLGMSAIKAALKKLEKEGLVMVGAYNSNPYDRTKWYSANALVENSQCTIAENSQSSITNSKPDNKGEREFFLAAWNENAEAVGIPKMRMLNDARYKKLKQRINANENFLDDLVECLGKVSGSKFLQAGSWFGFDWLVANDTNYMKVLEGSYDNK